MTYITRLSSSLDISKGYVDNNSTVNKFGMSPNVDLATDTDIWDGADGTTGTAIWVPPTDARLHEITSTAAADDDGSTGATSVEVQGLDGDWALQTETVTMNGVADVTTANTYHRIFRMKVVTVGSGGVNAGIITATAQTDSTVTAAILAGNNQTLMAIYTVPANYTAYITSYYVGVVKATADPSFNIRLLVKPNASLSTAPYQLKNIQAVLPDSPHFQHFFDPPLPVSTNKSDIIMRATDCDKNNVSVAAGFDLVLEAR